MGLGVAELVLLGVVALGVFSVLGVVGFKLLERLLGDPGWHPDELESGSRRSSASDEAELMRDEQRWLGDRLTAVERRLPDLRRPLEGDPVDRLLPDLPDAENAEGTARPDGDGADGTSPADPGSSGRSRS